MSHALNENFGTDELMEELRDRNAFGKRGELVLVAQLVCIFLVMFPPMQLQGIVYLAGDDPHLFQRVVKAVSSQKQVSSRK